MGNYDMAKLPFSLICQRRIFYGPILVIEKLHIQQVQITGQEYVQVCEEYGVQIDDNELQSVKVSIYMSIYPYSYLYIS